MFKSNLIGEIPVYLNRVSTYLLHTPGITVKIIGTDCGMHSSSCYAHHIFGSLLTMDVVVRFLRLLILVDGKERSFIATYHVSDGIVSVAMAS